MFRAALVVDCSFNNVWLPVYIVFVVDGQVLLFFPLNQVLIQLLLDIDGDNKFIRWDLAIVAVGMYFLNGCILVYLN